MTDLQTLFRTVDELTPSELNELHRYIEKRQQRPQGLPGYLAVQYAREIDFDPDDLAEMARVIEEECERIDPVPEVKFDE